MGDLPKINLGQKPTDNVEISIYVDITDPNKPIVLSQEEETFLLNRLSEKAETKEKELVTSKLPDTIIELKSYWRRPTFLLNQVVELNCYVDKIIQGRIQRLFDLNALTIARIRVLLSGWDLDTKIDPYFKLKTEPSIDSKDVHVLTDETMRMIGAMNPPEVISMMYTKAHSILFVQESPTIQNFLKEKAEKEKKAESTSNG